MYNRCTLVLLSALRGVAFALFVLGSGAGCALPQGLAVGSDRAVALSCGPSSTSWQASPARAGAKSLACAVLTVWPQQRHAWKPRGCSIGRLGAHVWEAAASICTRHLLLQRLSSKPPATSMWLMPSTCFCRAVGVPWLLGLGVGWVCRYVYAVQISSCIACVWCVLRVCSCVQL